MSIQQEKFKEIADAIRKKTGTTDLIKPNDFANKINDVHRAGRTQGLLDFEEFLKTLAPTSMYLDVYNLDYPYNEEGYTTQTTDRTYGADGNIKISAYPDVLYKGAYIEDGVEKTGWVSKANHDRYWTVADNALFTTNYKTLNADGTVKRTVSGKINIGFSGDISVPRPLLISFSYKGAISSTTQVIKLYPDIGSYDKCTPLSANSFYAYLWKEYDLGDGWKRVYMVDHFGTFEDVGTTDKVLADCTLRFECKGDLWVKDLCVISLRNHWEEAY